MGGEFPPRSLTVLTAAYWSDVASWLKRDTRLAAQAGVRGCRAQGTSSQRGTKKRAGRRAMSKFRSSFVIPSDRRSITYVWGVVERPVCVCICLEEFASPLAFVFSSCSSNPETGVHKQWLFFQHIGKWASAVKCWRFPHDLITGVGGVGSKSWLSRSIYYHQVRFYLESAKSRQKSSRDTSVSYLMIVKIQRPDMSAMGKHWGVKNGL